MTKRWNSGKEAYSLVAFRFFQCRLIFLIIDIRYPLEKEQWEDIHLEIGGIYGSFQDPCSLRKVLLKLRKGQFGSGHDGFREGELTAYYRLSQRRRSFIADQVFGDHLPIREPLTPKLHPPALKMLGPIVRSVIHEKMPTVQMFMV
jgi:hypothetical protein